MDILAQGMSHAHFPWSLHWTILPHCRVVNPAFKLVAGALGKLVLPSSGLRSRLLHVSRLLCVLFLGTVSCKLRLVTTNPAAIQFSKLAEPMRWHQMNPFSTTLTWQKSFLMSVCGSSVSWFSPKGVWSPRSTTLLLAVCSIKCFQLHGCLYVLEPNWWIFRYMQVSPRESMK